MAEEKSPLNANAISPPVHGNLSSIDQAKKNWMDRLEKDIDAAEESEKAYT
ncbi:MAG: hypothetical protein K0Q74_960, partial [Gammaproteobacteria bacterium]|nr:hypothetical protein [Gammaproteobacteria bacterium]